MVPRSCRGLLAWIGLLAAGVATPALASADSVYADLSREDDADVVSLALAPAPGPRLWHAASDQSRLLNTGSPIIGVLPHNPDGNRDDDLLVDPAAPFLPGADARDVALDSTPVRFAPSRVRTPSAVRVPAASRAPPTN